MTSPAHPKGANTAGWRVVPARRMTEAMAAAHDAGHCIEAQWADMVSAAPSPDYDAMAVGILRNSGYGDERNADEVKDMAAALRGYFEGE